MTTPEKNKNVPELRFPEFKGEWEKNEFGKRVERRKDKYNPENDNKNYPCIELESLSQETGQLLNTFNSSKLKSIKNKFQSGDVLFGKLRPYLKKYYKATFDGVCSSEIWVLNGKQTENDFIYYLIQHEKFNYEVNLTTGSKMPRAEWNYISGIKFHFPSNPEQQKIASFLTVVDKRIHLLNQKKEKLDQYKKGVMQKLFSRELRFRDENGNDYPEWEEKKLGDIGSVRMCKRIFTQQTMAEGEIPFYKIGTLGKIPDAYIKRKLFEEYKSKYNYPKKGYTLITCSGTIGKCIQFDGRDSYFQDSNIVWIENSDKDVLDDFLYLLLSNYQWGKLNSTTITRIYTSDLKILKFKFPCIQEQQKIASFLSAIDKQIEQVTRQIGHSNQWKKGLLQKMFV